MIARVTVCATYDLEGDKQAERVVWANIWGATLQDAISNALQRTKAAFLAGLSDDLALECEKAERVSP